MKRTLLTGGFLLIFLFAGAHPASLYLSPSGNDSGSGTHDQPVATLPRAFALAQQQSPDSDTVFIRLAQGTYQLNETFTIDRNDRPIVFVGPDEGTAEVSGGFPISGWQPWERGVWRTRVPEVSRYGARFEQLFVNGRRAVPARSPNSGYFSVEAVKETILYTGHSRSAEHAAQQITVAPSEIASLARLTPAEIAQVRLTFYHKWDVTRKGVDYAVPDSGYLFVSGEAMKPWNPIAKNDRYLLSNLLSALDEAGEWYLSPDGWLYYHPLPGEDLSTARCIAPSLEKLMVIKGTPDRPVKNLFFRNITFAHSSYLLPTGGDEPMQAAAGTPAAIEADYAQRLGFEHCELLHTGTYALWLRRECFDIQADRCLLSDLGAGGVKIGETAIRPDGREVTARIKVNNCIVQHAGYVFPCGVGISIFQASDCEITHNEISDIRYSGVSVGWKWGYNDQPYWSSVSLPNGKEEYKQVSLPSPAVRNKINYNHIHHIGWAELSDMGAVYTLGVSPGTMVCNNVIHDIYSYDYGGWGLYTDEGSTDVRMMNNLVYRCKSGGFHQHYGEKNYIENNIFAYGYRQSLQFTRVEKHISFYFRHNIILQNDGRTLSGPWKNSTIEMDDNCYWDLRSTPITFDGLTFREWQQYKDKHSVVANPYFKDPAAGDYSFTSLKTARRIGFKPFDYSKAGVYGSAEWVQKARLSDDILRRFDQAVMKREQESGSR